jgi:hypothetical protein
MLAAASVTVLLVAGCSGDSDDAPDSTPASPVQTQPAAPADVQSVLLSEQEHPEGTTGVQTMPLRQASALVLPGTGEPSGVVVMPRCMSYFAAIGGLGTLDGWHQFGLRNDGTLFINLVASVPDAEEAIEILRMRIAACNEGLMTIQGWPPSALSEEGATGTMAFAENDALTLPGATVFTFTQTVTFHDPDDPTVGAVRQAWGCPETPCTSQAVLVAADGVLIYVLEGEDLAVEIATAMYERVSA